MYCTCPSIGNQSVCDRHRRRKDNMRTQAKKGGATRLKAFDDSFKDPELATEAMRENEATWPDGSKWGKQLAVDWAQFERRWGKTVSSTDRTKTRPWELEEFITHCIEKMRWSRVDAEQQWEGHKNNPAVFQDELGNKGCL